MSFFGLDSTVSGKYSVNYPIDIICHSGVDYNAIILFIILDCCLSLFAVFCQVYSWGCNKLGQLGHMNSLRTVPQHVKVFSPLRLSLTLK